MNKINFNDGIKVLRSLRYTILSNSNDLLDFLYLGSFDFEEESCPSSSQPSAVWPYIVQKEWNPYFVHCQGVNTTSFFFFFIIKYHSDDEKIMNKYFLPC